MPDDAPSSDQGYLQRSLDLLWNGLPPVTRGPSRSLTLEAIAIQAIAIADGDGLDALSMRRLARELEVGTMSLYRYVPDKGVLLDVMLDHVSGADDGQAEPAGSGWRAVLEASARSGRALYLRHPWLIEVNWTRPVLGPGSVRSMERLMAGLGDVPLSDQEKVMVSSLLDGFLVGNVRQEIQYQQAITESGTDEEAFWQAQYPYLERAMGTGDFPTLAAMSDDAFQGGWEETFELGLGMLLDGIGAEISRGR